MTQPQMECFGLTDVGEKRAANEDQFLIADLNKSMLIHQTSLKHDDHSRLFGGSQGKLLLVADGMGGHRAGERASSLAIDTLARYVLNAMPWFLQLRQHDEDDLKIELAAALERCQKKLEAEASVVEAEKDMGTTLTMAYLIWPRLYVVHAGDSRCYLLRGTHLEQITKDHTIAQQMVDTRALTPKEAEDSRWSHVLWNCIGGGTPELRPEVYRTTLKPGDTLLLCTDGLTKSIRTERIIELLREQNGPDETCRRLVRAANNAGGSDNITAIVARFAVPATQTPHSTKEDT